MGSIELEGVDRKFWGFTLTLGFSRMVFATAVLDQKLGTLQRIRICGLKLAYEVYRYRSGVIEGKPQRWQYDLLVRHNNGLSAYFDTPALS